MIKKLKATPKKEKIKLLILGISVLVLVLVTALADVLFPSSQFSLIVAGTVGKFFDIGGFFTTHYVTILESLTILFFVWLLYKLISLLLTIFVKKDSKGEMVAELLKSILKYLSVIVTGFLILSAWGVQTATLLAGAGIIALALSFGAQSLIEDIISGIFIIFEKQFSTGDVIEVGGFRGKVISMDIRITKIEDINGDIKIFNNSDIRGAINTSTHLSFAISNISISYSEDIKKVEKVIEKNLASIKEHIPDIVEGPYYRGVKSLADSSVVLEFYAKTKELKRYQVARDLNRELKIMFDENGIQIPFPQLVVHMEKEKPESK